MQSTTRPSLPWWRVPAMWLVVLGPSAVVVAGFVTLGIALKGSDRPLPTGPALAGVQSTTPAQQARNHVAGTTR